MMSHFWPAIDGQRSSRKDVQMQDVNRAPTASTPTRPWKSAIGATSELLMSAWVLSGEQPDDMSMPSSHGVLDRALQAAFEQGAFPEWAREALHFADSRVGLRCVELPEMLAWAQSAQMTAAPNPS